MNRFHKVVKDKLSKGPAKKEAIGSGLEKVFERDFFTIPTEAEDNEIRRILGCRNYYDVLEVNPKDDLDEKEEELVGSYMDKCLLLQPNQCEHPKLPEAYQKLQEAYDTLSDYGQREDYRRKVFGPTPEELAAQRAAAFAPFGAFTGGAFGIGPMTVPEGGTSTITIIEPGGSRQIITSSGGFGPRVRLIQSQPTSGRGSSGTEQVPSTGNPGTDHARSGVPRAITSNDQSVEAIFRRVLANFGTTMQALHNVEGPQDDSDDEGDQHQNRGRQRRMVSTTPSNTRQVVPAPRRQQESEVEDDDDNEFDNIIAMDPFELLQRFRTGELFAPPARRMPPPAPRPRSPPSFLQNVLSTLGSRRPLQARAQRTPPAVEHRPLARVAQAAAPPTVPRRTGGAFDAALAEMEAAGFTNRNLNRQVLLLCDGDPNLAVEYLLNHNA